MNFKEIMLTNEVTEDTEIPLCPHCHTPQAIKMVMMGKLRLLPVMCECRKKEVEKLEKAAKDAEFQEVVRSLRKNSLMDERFKDSNFKNVIVTEGNKNALKIARRYCTEAERMLSENQGLMFTGGVGTGKTLIAACMANELINNGYYAIMTSIVKMLDNGYRNEDEAYINKLNKADFLFIDDFGAERKTDYAYERIYNLIDSRYRVKKPLIITTNLSVPQMTQRIDMQTDRIYDRVLEMCYPVEITGTSWRLISAKQRYERSVKEVK